MHTLGWKTASASGRSRVEDELRRGIILDLLPSSKPIPFFCGDGDDDGPKASLEEDQQALDGFLKGLFAST